ncbi:sigma-54-dependent Fis family transcriptional regulator [bacterium]|nr:sigma-54-dependent Fis family transcriptional regulator [bacterium]
MKILIVDDEQAIRKTFNMVLSYADHSVVEARTAEEALQKIKGDAFDVVFLDVKLPKRSGLEIVPDIKKASSGTYIIVITGHGNVVDAVDAMKMGVYDYMEKPVSVEKIKFLLNNIGEEKSILTAYSQLLQQAVSFELVGEAGAIEHIRQTISKVAVSDATVLITGENGTGKEVVARMIHKSSELKGGFVVVNCAALPEDLIESELFGYRKGAFTGAERDKPGKIELANNGTLFLDEIGDMSPRTQAKLLRVLQFKRFSPLGDTIEKEVKVRFIAATNRNLSQQIEKEHFREDLFFRLNEVPIDIPPLRDRQMDVPLLIDFIKGTFMQGDTLEFEEAAMDLLSTYSFPGNIRELRNFIKRLIILSGDNVVDKSTLLSIIPELKGDRLNGQKAGKPKSYGDYMDMVEKSFVLEALERNNWVISKTADDIDMQRSNLYKKIQKYDLKKDDAD